MLPLIELSPVAARALVGVVFDVDDTLTRDGRLETVAYAALSRLHEAGLALIAVTGRPLGFAELMARMWPLAAAVGENGAGYVRVDRTGLRRGYYAPDDARAEHARRLDRVRARVERDAPFARYTDDSWARRCDVAWDIGERLQLPAAEIEMLRGLIEAEGARCLVSSVHAHAHIGDYDKASGAIQAGREVLGLDLDRERDHFLFVGDSGNDAAAFAHFPLSVGVANVAAHLGNLPVAPRFVSQADRGRGFAEIATWVLQQRGS
jgi:hydroxymethylpyrimidine pyrophosphatase-like HAD family hydrolase